MQVTDKDPTTDKDAAPVKANIFALGDCTQTRHNEEKNVPSMYNFVPVISQNIIALAHGKELTATSPETVPIVAWISLGPEYCIQSVGDQVDASAEIGATKVGVMLNSANGYTVDATVV
jgi:NADH dehydrogenase FAD-containing subunit